MQNLRMKYVDSKSFLKHSLSDIQASHCLPFGLMVAQLKMHVPAKGRPIKLSIEDQILLCLSYWREYWTLFNVATSYGVSEPTTSRIVRHVEGCLLKFNLFNLPKHLLEGEGIDWNMGSLMPHKFQYKDLKNRRKAIVGREKVILLKYRRSFIIEIRNSEFMHESWFCTSFRTLLT